MRGSIVIATLSIGCGSSMPDSVDAAEPQLIEVHTPLAPNSLVIYRAGDGPWMTTSGAASPVTFLAVDRYTVAVTCSIGPRSAQSVVAYEMTVQELRTINYDRHCGGGTAVVPAATISGMVTGEPTPGFDRPVRWGAFSTVAGQPGSPAPYSMNVTLGTNDLVVGNRSCGGPVCQITHLMIVSDLIVAADVVVDVNLGDETRLIKWTAAGARGAANTLTTSNGTQLGLSSSSYNEFFYAPLSIVGPNDRQDVTVILEGNQPNVRIRQYARVPTKAFVAPPPLPPPPLKGADHAVWYWQPDAVAYELSLAPGWTVHFSPARVLADSLIRIPELWLAPGWDSSLSPTTEVLSTALVKADVPIDDVIRLAPTSDAMITTFKY